MPLSCQSYDTPHLWYPWLPTAAHSGSTCMHRFNYSIGMLMLDAVARHTSTHRLQLVVKWCCKRSYLDHTRCSGFYSHLHRNSSKSGCSNGASYYNVGLYVTAIKRRWATLHALKCDKSTQWIIVYVTLPRVRGISAGMESKTADYYTKPKLIWVV